MVKDNKNMVMVIFIGDNLLMVYLKDMDNIYGRILVHIEEILSKVRDQDMEYGKQMKGS